MAWSWTPLQAEAVVLRRRLQSVLRDKAEQGYDTAAAVAELEAAPDSLDALVELAMAIADLPLRSDWPYVEPTDLDDIWDECSPQRPRGSLADISPAEAEQRVRERSCAER